MNKKERLFMTVVLAIIVVMVATDLLNDSFEGVRWWHLTLESATALAALVGIFLLMRGSFFLRKSLAAEKIASTQLKAEAERWRSISRKYMEGLSETIDGQLSKWGLTASEKEVAFFLLKGLSLKEIAEIRKTTEKTARTQSISIYSKAGLAGRSELAAFFLEDLLPPAENAQNTDPSKKE